MKFKLIEDLGNTFVYAVGFETEVNIYIHEDEEPDIDIKDSYEYDELVDEGIEEILDSIKKTLYNNKDEICSKLGITHFSIVDSDIDYNLHMNNTHYPDMIVDYLPSPETHSVKELMLSFLQGALYNEELSVHRTSENGVFYFKTLNSDGKTCLESLIKTEPRLDTIK